MKVPRLGEKVFEQAAGFLRINGANNPLDSSAVHPESYPIVKQMATDLGCSVTDLMSTAELRKQLDIYGSLTTFNVLFKYKEDQFVGEKSD
jgi:uncharacterized protein